MGGRYRFNRYCELAGLLASLFTPNMSVNGPQGDRLAAPRSRPSSLCKASRWQIDTGQPRFDINQRRAIKTIDGVDPDPAVGNV